MKDTIIKILKDNGVAIVCFLSIFVFAIFLHLFGVLESFQQFVAVLASAAATYIIVCVTMNSQNKQQLEVQNTLLKEQNKQQLEVQKALLEKQSENEAEKEKRIKVYEEKLRIYQEFLNCLYDVIKDGKVTNEEAIRLQFQTSYITMHTESENIKNIAEQVEEIVKDVKNDNNARLMQRIFEIVKVFKKELYPINLTEIDSKNFTDAVESFSNIIDAVDVKGEEKNTEPAIDTPADLNDILKKFTYDLIGRISADENKWNVETGELKDGIYVNYAWKGNEEGVRVLLDYEKDGNQYFQIHLDYNDTHEAYKHMKWRFGGRQTKWGWWKYLDTSIRNLKDTREIREHDWEEVANSLTKQLKTLLTYVESFERIHREIYQRVPKDKANVWLFYETCVAFDYDKTLGEEKLFIDVVLNNT